MIGKSVQTFNWYYTMTESWGVTLAQAFKCENRVKTRHSSQIITAVRCGKGTGLSGGGS